jgi:hypothetical protein
MPQFCVNAAPFYGVTPYGHKSTFSHDILIYDNVLYHMTEPRRLWRLLPLLARGPEYHHWIESGHSSAATQRQLSPTTPHLSCRDPRRPPINL